MRAKISGFREDTGSLVSGAVAAGWASLKACVTQRAGALGDPEKAPWETVGLFPECAKGLCLSQEDCAWATVNGNSLRGPAQEPPRSWIVGSFGEDDLKLCLLYASKILEYP